MRGAQLLVQKLSRNVQWVRTSERPSVLFTAAWLFLSGAAAALCIVTCLKLCWGGLSWMLGKNSSPKGLSLEQAAQGRG